jgi:cytochrome c oxidase subunit II
MKASRWRGGAVLVLLGVLVLAGCGSNLGFPTPVTKQGAESRDLWRVFVFTALAIGAIVYCLVVFVVLRYRHRRPGDGENPDQRQYNVPLEIFYTALPLVIVGVLFGLSIRTERDVTSTAAPPDLTVRVVGFQWQWQFVYEGTPVTITGVPGKDPVLVLPTERNVRLEMVSADVVHSFWVPHFIEKRDLTPRVDDNAIEVRITQPGQWAGVCSEFCGLDHTKMRFSVKALPGDQFDAWLASGGPSS